MKLSSPQDQPASQPIQSNPKAELKTCYLQASHLAQEEPDIPPTVVPVDSFNFSLELMELAVGKPSIR